MHDRLPWSNNSETKLFFSNSLVTPTIKSREDGEPRVLLSSQQFMIVTTNTIMPNNLSDNQGRKRLRLDPVDSVEPTATIHLPPSPPLNHYHNVHIDSMSYSKDIASLPSNHHSIDTNNNDRNESGSHGILAVEHIRKKHRFGEDTMAMTENNNRENNAANMNIDWHKPASNMSNVPATPTRNDELPTNNSWLLEQQSAQSLASVSSTFDTYNRDNTIMAISATELVTAPPNNRDNKDSLQDRIASSISKPSTESKFSMGYRQDCPQCWHVFLAIMRIF
ncbi:hypothetical protein BDF19DRAFT_464156 [Syncephalis fuscata]|nr:hypothetical protein BDF19DRAFT_464156 [Syncephalis fuscata]